MLHSFLGAGCCYPREGVTVFLSYQPSMFTGASWLEHLTSLEQPSSLQRGSEPHLKATNCFLSIPASTGARSQGRGHASSSALSSLGTFMRPGYSG